MNKKKAKKWFVIGCLAPAMILFLIFMVYPTINIFAMSVFRWGGLSANKEFVGLYNFQTLLNDTNFLRALQNTIFIIAIVTVITMAIAIIFASILSREKIKGQNFFRIVFYIPNILSVVVISSIFSAIYDPSENGMLNSILALFHGEGWETIKFLGDSNIVLYAIIGALIWQAIGYYMVMYMASMANIPDSLYESASLEGAGRIKQFFSITLPLIWTNIRTTLTFFVISTINMSFLMVKAMTNGGPDGASNVFLSYMYQEAYTNSSYGYGMAIGVAVFLFSFALAAVLNAATKREEIEF